jgi:hypothetical protein
LAGEFDFFQHSGRSTVASDGDMGGDPEDDDFDFFVDGAHSVNNSTRAAKKPKLSVPVVAALRQGNGQGGGKKGVKETDAQRLNSMMAEFEGDMSLKMTCDTCVTQGRVMQTSCNDKKCRSRMYQEGFENDYDGMELACRLARRQFSTLQRLPHIRQIIGVAGRHDPKQRILQVHGVDVCLSFWAWWYGFSKYLVGKVLGEIKKPDGAVKGDMRQTPMPRDHTIKAAVCVWMKTSVNELTQDNPEVDPTQHTEGGGSAVGGVLSAIETGPKPRKFLGGIKVRGVLYDIYCIAQETDVTGTLLYCAKGYFKELFESQYGRKTGPATGNFWATDSIRSLMGGYCLKCSSAALQLQSSDELTRIEGKKEHLAHITWIKKIAEVLEEDKRQASLFLVLLEGDDAATSSGTALPILRKMAQKFVKNRVGFKIMQLVLFWRSHPTYCLRAVGAPWVQGTANFQVHCMLYCSLPNMAQYYHDIGKPVPQTYIRWSDGGGDTWNLTLIAIGYWLVSMNVFNDVYIKRPEKDHSHNVWDRCVADQQSSLRLNPGKGAITPELLMDNLKQMPHSDAMFVDQTLDFTSWLNKHVFKGFKYYTEVEMFWFHREADFSITVRCAASAASPRSQYVEVARGTDDECFFQSNPEGSPDLSPFWNKSPKAATAAQKDFDSSTKAVAKQTSELPDSFLTVHGHAASEPARQSIRGSWDRHRAAAPTAGGGGSIDNAESVLTFPPPCFEAIKQTRVALATTPITPATGDGACTASVNRVTSNVPAVLSVQEAVSLQRHFKVPQPSVKEGEFYIVMQAEKPVLWLAQVVDVVVASELVSAQARLLPPSKGGKRYWAHASHTCALKKEGFWADVMRPNSCSGARCVAGGTVNVRFFYPEADEETSALEWAKSLLEGRDEAVPTWLKGHWVKRTGDHAVNEVLGNIGPRVSVIKSHAGKKIRLNAKSVVRMKATALQLIESNHPCQK